MTTARRTFVEPPLSQLPPLLRGPAHVPDRLVDAADRARLVRPRATKSPAYPHGSPFAVGVMAFAQFLPFTLFGLFAGVITDRLDARRLVLATQTGQTIWPSSSRGSRSPASRSRGCSTRSRSSTATILVLDAPSRQQLTYRMVGRETLPNAIALNSSLFNASRILGPSVGGDSPRVRRRRRLLPRQRDQLRRGARRTAHDADERVLPARGVRAPEHHRRHEGGARVRADAAADARRARR